MKIPSVLLLAVSLLACAHRMPEVEPADPAHHPHALSRLSKLGWKISAPRNSSQISALAKAHGTALGPGEWEKFISQLQPGDELREVDNNAGAGCAIFRKGDLVTMYIWLVRLLPT